LPFGKRLHDDGKIHHFEWEHPLFLCPFNGLKPLNHHEILIVAVAEIGTGIGAGWLWRRTGDVRFVQRCLLGENIWLYHQ
jgi:hypothetical protein